MKQLTRTKKDSRRYNKRIVIAATVVLAFAVLGGFLIFKSRAATNPNLPSDLNNDGVVNLADLSLLLANYGKASTAYDLNADGTITLADLSILLANYSKTASAGPVGGDGPADPSDCPNTAAAKYNWGEPQYQSNFNTAKLDPTWHPYGPEPGHEQRGTRTPAAMSMSGGNVTISSDGKGTTGAMKWFPGQKYGRWEVCMKVATGNQHYVLLLWPDQEDWPQGGEYDFFEESGGATSNKFWLHCPTSSGGNCASASPNVDARQWHSIGMEWTPSGVKGYVDGNQNLNYTGASAPRPMDLCIQLDWFGDSGSDAMIIDSAKQWSVQGSVPSSLGLKPGEPATGQPDLYPSRVPRAMTPAQMRGQ
jgi:hypothetical protein